MPSTTTTSRSHADPTALVTALFSGGTPVRREGVSPAGAFQDALYGRSVLVDVRGLAERLRTGQVDPQLFGEMIELGEVPDPLTAAYQATLDHPGVPAHVLADDDSTARRIVTRLAWLGVPATHVVGGFPAWEAAGLPVRRLE
ncbi:MAG: hypothetical protein IPI32_10430 [Austwickia sp.]|nr:hypothetical protein [Austwickia sp.]MBK9101775.1 hypothetical protein [Austwickia sp.]